MPRYSIRWRLPLSYAAIALLATLALGSVLLLMLRGYYLRVERDYLRSNARAIGFGLAKSLEEKSTAEVLQSQLDNLSFLSGTRVSLFDAGEQLLASSKSGGRVLVALADGRSGKPFPTDDRWMELIGSGEPLSITLSTLDGTVVRIQPDAARRIFPPSMSIPVRPPPEGVTPWAVSQGGEAYSGEVVRVPVLGSADQLLGYVELSHGPAYAREIVGNVAWGLGIAGVVAVVLAAATGWAISRRISAPLGALTRVTAAMAAGDLAARADATRKDELGTLARSFNRMADQVEEIVTTLRRFVSDAAHEIHTPLTALRTNLELARQEAQTGTGEYVAQAQAQVERLEALTGGLLDLSRLESPAQASKLVPVPLLRLLNELGELYASRAEQAGLTFDWCLPETAVSALGEEVQLKAALANVLDNALRFTPEGGRIWLGCRQEEDAIVLWVEDTGIGLPEADLPHLFERFYRGSNAGGYPGSGLGLAIVKAAVERNGGSVRAERTEQGSRFTISLPSRRSRSEGLAVMSGSDVQVPPGIGQIGTGRAAYDDRQRQSDKDQVESRFV